MSRQSAGIVVYRKLRRFIQEQSVTIVPHSTVHSLGLVYNFIGQGGLWTVGFVGNKKNIEGGGGECS